VNHRREGVHQAAGVNGHIQPLQESVMSFALFIRRSSFVAVALSLIAFGVTSMPAAAQPQPFPIKPVVNPVPLKPIVNPIPIKPIVNPIPIKPIPIVNPPKPLPGPIVKPIDICVIMPSKCVKPVVINPPPVIIAPAPILVEETHVIARPEPVHISRPVAVETPVASESCNCLTKQYQNDGSVIFRDLCTHEAAMATQADLQAQAQAAAQEQTQAAPAR
jgi:hypothetical protein